MTESYNFVASIRSLSQLATTVINQMGAINEQATALGYPANLDQNTAFTGTNANQSVATVTAALTVLQSIQTALQANSDAGLTAIYNGAA